MLTWMMIQREMTNEMINPQRTNPQKIRQGVLTHLYIGKMQRLRKQIKQKPWTRRLMLKLSKRSSLKRRIQLMLCKKHAIMQTVFNLVRWTSVYSKMMLRHRALFLVEDGGTVWRLMRRVSHHPLKIQPHHVFFRVLILPRQNKMQFLLPRQKIRRFSLP